MTAVTVRPVGRPDPVREQHIVAGHHNLAFCESCDQPVAGPLTDCPHPDCRQRARDRNRLFVQFQDGADGQRDEQRCEDVDHDQEGQHR